MHARLTVQDLWLRYLALGGLGDAFDLDGYLQGVVPLETFQQDILAQAINEALEDSYRSYRITLSTPSPDHPEGRKLSRLIDELLHDRPTASPAESEPGRGDSA